MTQGQQFIAGTVALAVMLIMGDCVTHAQAPVPIDAYEARFYLEGAAEPVSTYPFVAATVLCNQLPPDPEASSVNPTRLVWDDPDESGAVCEHSPAPGGPLFALPVPGSYEATLVASNEGGESPESGRASFFTIGPPAELTGLRLVR